jgi:filamentous hemagglutinin
MPWPPRVGEPLPRAAGAIGIRRKLIDYSLNPTHERGGAKARGFQQILGITVEDADYLESEIRAGILIEPVTSIRPAIPTGFNFLVEVPIRGIGAKSNRLISVRTAWLLSEPGAFPRMTTAFLKP